MTTEFPTRIQLTVQEPLGVDRPRYPVTLGVPFPQGVLATAEDLRVEAKGDALPLQTRVMLRWPDDSIKWVLVDFQADLQSGEDNHFDLIWGEQDGGAPTVADPVTCTESSDGLTVATGPLSFTIVPSGPLPFRNAELNGEPAIEAGGLQSSIRIDGTAYELHAGGPATVEEDGPLRVVVRADGLALSDDGTAGFDVTARLYAFAGRSDLRVYMTLTNRMRKRLVHLEEWKVSLTPALGEAREGFIVSSAATGHRRSHVDGLVEGYRALRVDLVDMPFPPWDPDSREMIDETPEQPRRANPEYAVLPGEDGRDEDRRPGADWHTLMPAAAVLGDASRSVTLMCHRFWYQAPKEVALTDSRMELALYPHWAEPLEWYRGVAKTHELVVDLRPGRADREERLAFGCGQEKRPSPQVATRNWMVDTGVFGPVFRYEPEKYRWWEYILRAAINKHTFNVEHDPLMGFSILDYGDFWRTGRGGQWYNNEMDKGYGLILQMVRTGYAIVLEHIDPIIHHQIDVDTCHDAGEDWWIGSQRYHFAKHGVTRGPALCHQWIDGPLFYYLLTGYKRAEEVARARADHFCKAVGRGEHRIKTLTRVAGYPLMALSRMHENYGDEKYLATCEKILDWLDEWHSEDGGYYYVAYTPPGQAKVATALSDGILSCALMRHHIATGSERSWQILKRMVDDDLDANGLFTPEGFSVKSTSPFRNYHEPEPDFFFEALMYMTQKTGDSRYADVGYADMQRIFAQRRMLSADANDLPPHFYRYWLPALARAEELGILRDPQPF